MISCDNLCQEISLLFRSSDSQAIELSPFTCIDFPSLMYCIPQNRACTIRILCALFHLPVSVSEHLQATLSTFSTSTTLPSSCVPEWSAPFARHAHTPVKFSTTAWYSRSWHTSQRPYQPVHTDIKLPTLYFDVFQYSQCDTAHCWKAFVFYCPSSQ